MTAMPGFDANSVSRESRQQLDFYVETLMKWQQRINLIGPSTANQLWLRHIDDSLQLLPLIEPTVQSIADLGTGAGFPGLVLAIVGRYQTHLYESNGKKVAFLQEIIRKTGCPAIVHHQRIENLRDSPTPPPVQLVVSRAFAPLTELLTAAEPFFLRGATGLFHKGQDIDAELTAATKYWKINWKKHQSSTDSRACLLSVKEAYRVEHSG